MSDIFLKARWENLIMANYIIDPQILQKYLPYKTELDIRNGNCYVSLVGFLFRDTKVLGIKFPFHVEFEEVNLRFYVTHNDGKQIKRGVVFISEIVPKKMITLVANTIYKEHYQCMPMKHQWASRDVEVFIKYDWKKTNWHSLSVFANRDPVEMLAGSDEEFITEHFWGYSKKGENKAIEYGVEHPRWKIHPIINYNIDVDFKLLYGDDFAMLNQMKPASVFLANGSEVIVRKGNVIL